MLTALNARCLAQPVRRNSFGTSQQAPLGRRIENLSLCAASKGEIKCSLSCRNGPNRAHRHNQ